MPSSLSKSSLTYNLMFRSVFSECRCCEAEDAIKLYRNSTTQSHVYNVVRHPTCGVETSADTGRPQAATVDHFPSKCKNYPNNHTECGNHPIHKPTSDLVWAYNLVHRD